MTLRAVLILIGFTAVIAQIVLMRELIVVFYGNEISLGLMLAAWLLWTAAGSGILGRMTARVRAPRKWLAGLEVLISIALPLTIFLVRSSKRFFQSVPGEILGPGPMVLTSFLALSFFCAVSGWLFAAGSRLYADERLTPAAQATGSVYLLEGIGSGIGGLLASIVLIRHFTAFEIASLVALLNLLAAATLVFRTPLYRRAVVSLSLVVLFVILVFPRACPRLEALSLAQLWRDFSLIDTRNSIYGNLALVDMGGNATLFENGLAVLTVPDPEAAEEAVHFALLQHPSPRSLLLIGGGVNGSVAQALQHPSLERLDYVELDPTILDLARQHFPREWTPIATDPRVRVHNVDGRLFLKTAGSTFDVIVVNLPDPQTAQLNRFYTLEFFHEAARKLSPSGVLSFQVTGAENYISPELAQFLRCLNNTLRPIFAEVVAIPGGTIHFFAAAQPGTLVADADGFLSRLQSRRLRTTYVREYYLPFRMMPGRMLDLESQMRPQSDTPINRDFAPIAYYFDVALWSSRFHSGSRELFQFLARLDFTHVAAVVGLILLALAAALRWLAPKRRRLPSTAGYCVAAMGFTLIGLEILLLLAFQAIYGYVYHQLAIVVACFMVGVALGSWRALSRAVIPGPAAERRDLKSLARLQVLAVISGPLLFVLFQALAGVESPAGLFLVSQILFPALALASGLLGGYQFPLASRVFFLGAEHGARSLGTVYALDLAGACLGAVVFSAFLIPVFGFSKTALLMAIVNLAPAILVALSFSQPAVSRD